jgi:hypothetical protein
MQKAFENKLPEATSTYDMEEEDGVENGDCPFVTWPDRRTTKLYERLKSICSQGSQAFK